MCLILLDEYVEIRQPMLAFWSIFSSEATLPLANPAPAWYHFACYPARVVKLVDTLP
jgi:hypothetical protein